MNGSWINIIGRLSHIQIIMGFYNSVFSFFVTTDFKRYIGDHLIRIHIGRSACTTVVQVNQKLVLVFAIDYCLACFLNQGQFFLTHSPHVSIGTGCGHLDHGICFYIIRIKFSRDTAYLEVFQCAGCLHTVRSTVRYLFFTQKISFSSRSLRKNVGCVN